MSRPYQFNSSSKSKKPTLTPISIRLTFDEKAKLEHAAAGMSFSAYIRSRLFGEDMAPRRKRHKARIKDNEKLSKILGVLGQSRIANNLNQLAKAVNMGTLPVTPDVERDIQEACTHVREMRKHLIEALNLKEGQS